MRHSVTASALCLLVVAVPPPAAPALAPSVRVSGCGGTILRQSDGRLWGISAGHCAKVGAPVTVTLSDGSSCSGKWLHIDPETDLAAFVVAFSTSKRVQVAQIAAQGVSGDYTANGSQGLIKLRRSGQREMKSTTGGTYERTLYAVKSGKFRNGDSGVGVWANGQLVGVASHGEDDEELYACRLKQLREFAGTVSAVADLPDWGDKDRTREILAIKKRLDELGGSTGVAGPAGPAGQTGPAGPAGKDGLPSDLRPLIIRIEELEKWRGSFRAVIRVKVVPKEKD
jgi:hypothetical protein